MWQTLLGMPWYAVVLYDWDDVKWSLSEWLVWDWKWDGSWKIMFFFCTISDGCPTIVHHFHDENARIPVFFVGFTACHETAPKSPGGIQTFPTFTPLLLGRVARNLCDGLVLGDFFFGLSQQTLNGIYSGISPIEFIIHLSSTYHPLVRNWWSIDDLSLSIAIGVHDGWAGLSTDEWAGV